MYDLAGHSVMLGYVSWADMVANKDSILIKALLNAGAVFYVKATMPQTGMALETWRCVFLHNAMWREFIIVVFLPCPFKVVDSLILSTITASFGYRCPLKVLRDRATLTQETEQYSLWQNCQSAQQ